MSVSISQMNVEMNLLMDTKVARAALCRAVLTRSVVSDSAIPRTVARQAPLPLGFSRQRILEWVAMPSSRGSSRPRDLTQVSHIAGGFFSPTGQ